jgi:hypothetical protein
VITLSSVNDYQFKKFQNTTRTFSSEEQFNLGMNYTDSPIEPGQSKVLFNFDIANDGMSLKPRASFRTTKIALCEDLVYQKYLDMTEHTGTQILSYVFEHVYNGITYTCAILFNSETKDLNICTIKGHLENYTNMLETKKMYFNNTGIKVKTRQFPNSNIHNIAIAEDNLTQIGTKAWNNNYFFFGVEAEESNLYNVKFNENTLQFEIGKVIPISLTSLEASPNKFNMLLNAPYTFTNSYVAGAFVLQGILPYENDNLVVSPRINTKYRYKLNYTVPNSTTYTIKWEWKDYSGTEWTLLKEENITFSAETPPEIYCDFTAPIKESLMRVTVTKADTTVPEQVSAIGINCDTETQQATANSILKNYDLATAKGMCYWQNRLVLWGFDDPLIFVSDTNLPEWFPYPNNTDLFEEPVIHCEPYLDTLLVFTTQKLFQLTMLSDGSGWSKTCIQDHLRLTEYDTNFIKTIKNMVFFKSGNSYFMVVPSSATAAGLTIAPISKPIQWLLDNYKTAVTELISDIYNYQNSLELQYCFNYINNSDIVVNYIFKDVNNLYLNFCLLYDTDNRMWRIHLFESQSIYKMYKLDATTDGTLVTFTELNINYDSNVIKVPAIQFITRDANNPKDFCVPKNTLFNVTTDLEKLFKNNHKYLNYQYLDTGYRALGEVNTKKRHREFQLRINNKSSELLKFGTSFYIDGEDRKNMYKYEVQHNTDITSMNYGIINVVPVLSLDTQIYSETILGDTEDDINAWTLDMSQFPDVPLNKIRIAVSGKGYHNKLKLLSINEKNYELLGLCWVFKYKNLR